MDDEKSRQLCNINVGVLGHVDCGKTSLCKVLSTTASTAAFDSNPQSKERGITLDLGFSSFILENKWAFTLVDCPGHSSLIRTVIGGAQIMDIMILVIDINKGMQAQAGECLILAQITSSHLIIVLNKVDLIPQSGRITKIAKATSLLRSTLSKTKFGDEPIVAVSAMDSSVGTENLKDALLAKVKNMSLFRNINSPFMMAVDHCFSVKGQGTVVTGTVIQGCVKINDVVEFPSLKETKKVKSIQSFRVSVNEAKAGDRIGVCVPGLDPSLIERSVICASGFVRYGIKAGIIAINPITYFKKPIMSKRRYHISIGYDTITAQLTLFRFKENVTTFQRDLVYEYVDQIDSDTDVKKDVTYFGLLEFDHPALNIPHSLIIGSDLQSGIETSCRLAFYGEIVDSTQDKNYLSTYLPEIKICKEKRKEGTVDRIVSDTAIIAKGFCKKDSNISHLLGLKVFINLPDTDRQLDGFLESRFGQTNKIRITLRTPLSQNEKLALSNKNVLISLKFKKFLYGKNEQPSGKLIQ